MLEALKLAGRTLLIVEDDMFIATAMREYLLEAGADMAEMCATVAQARELVEMTRFDAAVLDLTLPDGPITDLAEVLDANGTRIVFHTGRPLPEDVMQRLPDAKVLMKPSQPQALLDILASF
ncbi:MAG: response regulator [Pseudomonadota bacterium]